MELKPFDIFLTCDPASGLSGLILRAERALARDGKAVYSHVNHVDSNGLFLDTLWKVKHTPPADYNGRPCAIYRPNLPHADKARALSVIRQDMGELYPWQRLPLHLLRLADNIHWNHLVCSERTGKLLHLGFRRNGIFLFEKYYGLSPDDLHDIFRMHYHLFELIFEGVFHAD